ncbi:MAG: hypothetical protein NTV86_17475 [Planctomycetota bacterium]|nr:hypothetical protein [Planctomycetota bacterium]
MTQLDTALSNDKPAWRQITWRLMLIPVVGWAAGVGTFWAEVAIRGPKPTPATHASAPAPTQPATAPAETQPATQAAATQTAHTGKPHAPRGDYNDPFFYSLQDYLDRDYVAPVIVGFAALVYLLCAARHRSLLCLLLGLLAVNFTFRELRDNPGLEQWFGGLCGQLGIEHTSKTWETFMTKAVYFIAAALAVIAFPLRAWVTRGARGGVPTLHVHVECWLSKSVGRAMRADWRHTSWFLATFAAYAVALIVQRRTVKWGPSEQEMHRSLEEWTETVAHAMFVVSSLVAWRLKKPARAAA